VLKLRALWRDCTKHLAMPLLNFMQRDIDGQLHGIKFCKSHVR
jgi:hypothetical protein